MIPKCEGPFLNTVSLETLGSKSIPKCERPFLNTVLLETLSALHLRARVSSCSHVLEYAIHLRLIQLLLTCTLVYKTRFHEGRQACGCVYRHKRAHKHCVRVPRIRMCTGACIVFAYVYRVSLCVRAQPCTSRMIVACVCNYVRARAIAREKQCVYSHIYGMCRACECTRTYVRV